MPPIGESPNKRARDEEAERPADTGEDDED
jgi:hypothetical protein